MHTPPAPEDDNEAAVNIAIDGTLDLHAFAPADCREVLRAYIEAAAEAGVLDLRVVHGKGVGTLRTIVHTELARNPVVASFTLADASGGGWGATLVRLLPQVPRPRQIPIQTIMTQKTALVILHDGVEEMEAVAPIDILRRGGIAVTTAAAKAGDTLVTGRNGIRLFADTTLDALHGKTHDLILIPGGPGVAALRKNADASAALRTHADKGALLAAICAAPLVLLDIGAIDAAGTTAAYTAHPSTLGELPAARADKAVVIAQRRLPDTDTAGAGTPPKAEQTIITSRGAGTATAFALSVLEHLIGGEQGRKTAREVADSICLGAPQ